MTGIYVGKGLKAWESEDKLYAWTTTDPATSRSAELPATFYTNTPEPPIPSPVTSSRIYDAEGNDITEEFVHGAAFFTEATSDHMTWFTSEPI